MVNQVSDKNSCPDEHRDQAPLQVLVAQPILAVLPPATIASRI